MYTTYYPKFPIQDFATGNNWLLKSSVIVDLRNQQFRKIIWPPLQ